MREASQLYATELRDERFVDLSTNHERLSPVRAAYADQTPFCWSCSLNPCFFGSPEIAQQVQLCAITSVTPTSVCLMPILRAASHKRSDSASSVPTRSSKDICSGGSSSSLSSSSEPSYSSSSLSVARPLNCGFACTATRFELHHLQVQLIAPADPGVRAPHEKSGHLLPVRPSCCLPVR